MNKEDFNSLSDKSKVDYVIGCMHKAHDLFQVLYCSGVGFSQPVLEKLEHIGSEFSRIGLMVEEQNYTDVYDDLHKSLSQLNSIVAVVQEFIYKNSKIN